MSVMIVKLTWDEEEMSPMWMNEDNLKSLLYGQQHTSDEFLECEVLSHSELLDTGESK